MKESYVEGLATHDGPEPCAVAREGGGEASVGVRAGRVLSRESDSLRFGVPTPSEEAEGNTRCADIARRCGTPRGQRPRARTETPRTGTGRSHLLLRWMAPQDVSGSPRTYADDARSWEVGQLCSTEEILEQHWTSGGGGDGGKTVGQREHARAKQALDTRPGSHAKCARAGTSSCNGE